MNRRNSLDRAFGRMSARPPPYQNDWSDPSLPSPPTYEEAMVLSEKGRRGLRPEVETNLSEDETNIDEVDGESTDTPGQESLSITGGSFEDHDLNHEEQMSQERIRRRTRRVRDQISIGREEAEEMEMMNLNLEDEEDQSTQRYQSNHEEEAEWEHEISLIGSQYDFHQEGDNVDGHTSEMGSAGHSQSRQSITYECKAFPMLTPVISYVIKTLNRASRTKKIMIGVGVVFFLGLLLFVSLFPASFVYIDYDQMGFSRNKVTGVHDYSQVYQSGCYLLAPQDEIVSFPATAHFLRLKLSVMNAGGMSIGLTANLQYFLKPEELHLLYQKYHFAYPDVISSVAESTVKNTATEFGMEQYRLNRSFVETQTFRHLRLALSGDCCASCCPSCASWKIQCNPDNCKVDNCSLGYHVDARYFQLGDVSIPQQVLRQYMKQVLMKIEAEKEHHVQDASVQRIMTEYNVQLELNGAKEIRKVAEAEQQLIQARAEAGSDRDIQVSYLKSLKKFFSHVNISTEQEQISYIYMKALKDISHNLYAFSYNYDQKSHAISP